MKTVDQMTNTELTALYNSYAVKLQKRLKKRFSCKAVGQDWVARIQKDYNAALVSGKWPKAPKPPRRDRLNGNRFNKVRKADIRKPKQGTVFAKAFELLSTPYGITIPDLCEALDDMPRDTVIAMVRQMHTTLGYGLKTDSKGRVKVHLRQSV